MVRRPGRGFFGASLSQGGKTALKQDDYGPVPEREAVMCDAIAPVIRWWLAREARRYHFEYGPDAGAAPGMGILAAGAGLGERRIYAILHGESVYIDLDVADRLMMAMGRHLSEIPVVTKREAQSASFRYGDEARRWYEAQGNEWPSEYKASKALMPRVKRAYAQRTAA